jgi:hypothetical protein
MTPSFCPVWLEDAIRSSRHEFIPQHSFRFLAGCYFPYASGEGGTAGSGGTS